MIRRAEAGSIIAARLLACQKPIGWPLASIGATLAQAFNLMWLVQRACEIQVASAPLGKLREIPVPVLEGCVRDSLNFNPTFGAGEDSFAAMQRLIDRIDPGYRA